MSAIFAVFIATAVTAKSKYVDAKLISRQPGGAGFVRSYLVNVGPLTYKIHAAINVRDREHDPLWELHPDQQFKCHIDARKGMLWIPAPIDRPRSLNTVTGRAIPAKRDLGHEARYVIDQRPDR